MRQHGIGSCWEPLAVWLGHSTGGGWCFSSASGGYFCHKAFAASVPIQLVCLPKRGDEPITLCSNTMNTIQKASHSDGCTCDGGSGCIPKAAFAQTDEIQVYDAEIEDVGKFNVMVHSNFTPIGRDRRRISPARSSRTSRSTARSSGPTASPVGWSRGCISRFTPPTQRSAGGRSMVSRSASYSSGRTPDDHKFFYGVNFEFSVN